MWLVSPLACWLSIASQGAPRQVCVYVCMCVCGMHVCVNFLSRFDILGFVCSLFVLGDIVKASLLALQ